MQTLNRQLLEEVSAVVLAGGQARRMGGQDKGLMLFNGQPMIVQIVHRLQQQVSRLLINANRNQDEYVRLCNCPVIADGIGGYAGPLAGMASALSAIETKYLLTVPCDSPLLSPHYAHRMYTEISKNHSEICVAHDGKRMQPVFALLRRDLLKSLSAFLENDGHKIDAWYKQHKLVTADFSDYSEMFININTPDDHAQLEAELNLKTSVDRLL